MLPPHYRSPMYMTFQTVMFAFCLGVFLFLIIPIAIIVPMSFNPSSFFTFPPTGFSTKWYDDFFSNGIWLHSVKNSLIISLSATLIATGLGTLAALGLARSKARWRSYVLALLIMPMAVPIVIVAVATFFFFSLVGLVGTHLGLILAHASLGLPFVVVAVTATLQGFDRNMERAGASLGASPLRVFFRVTLPLIAPGAFAGAVFAFAISFDEVVVALFLASPEQRTLPIQIFSGTRQSITPTVTAAATLSILMAFGLMVVVGRLTRSRE